MIWLQIFVRPLNFLKETQIKFNIFSHFQIFMQFKRYHIETVFKILQKLYHGAAARSSIVRSALPLAPVPFPLQEFS